MFINFTVKNYLALILGSSEVILVLRGSFGLHCLIRFLARIIAFWFGNARKNILVPGFTKAAFPIAFPNESCIPEDILSAPAPVNILFSLCIWWGYGITLKRY